jgi:hypothetical protein
MKVTGSQVGFRSPGVAEKGPWVAQLAQGFKKYKEGEFEGSLLDYVRMAEIG